MLQDAWAHATAGTSMDLGGTRHQPHLEVLNMDWRERIVTDPDILMGKPTVKGTRLSAGLILRWLGQGWTVSMLLEHCPALRRGGVLPASAFAADMLRDERCIAIHQAARSGG